MRQNLFDSELHDCIVIGGFKQKVVTVAPTADMTLAAPLAAVYSIAPGAARNITLPNEAASAGATTTIINAAAGAFSLTIKASNGSTTVGTIDQSEGAICVCDGVRWKIMVNAET